MITETHIFSIRADVISQLVTHFLATLYFMGFYMKEHLLKDLPICMSHVGIWICFVIESEGFIELLLPT